MEENFKEIKTPPSEEKKILEAKKYDLSLINEKYELIMRLSESFIEFKLSPTNIISSYYYQEIFDLPTINKLLFTFFKEIKEVFAFYDKILNKKKVKLIKENDIIKLNMKNIINFDEEIETNLELKKIKLTKDDLINILLNEVNEFKNKESFIQKDMFMNEIKNINENIDTKINDLNNEINKYIQKLLTKKFNEFKQEQEIKINTIKIEYEKSIDIIKNEQELKLNEIKNGYHDKINELKSLYENEIINIKKNCNQFIELKGENDLRINEIKKEYNNNFSLFKNSEEIINKFHKEYELKLNDIDKKLDILYEAFFKNKEEKEENKNNRKNIEEKNVKLIQIIATEKPQTKKQYSNIIIKEEKKLKIEEPKENKRMNKIFYENLDKYTLKKVNPDTKVSKETVNQEKEEKKINNEKILIKFKKEIPKEEIKKEQKEIKGLTEKIYLKEIKEEKLKEEEKSKLNEKTKIILEENSKKVIKEPVEYKDTFKNMKKNTKVHVVGNINKRISCYEQSEKTEPKKVKYQENKIKEEIIENNCTKSEISQNIDKIRDFRDMFGLDEEEYSDEKLFEVLKENLFNFEDSFASLFS